MKKLVGYVISIVGIAAMALGFGMINLDLKILETISPNYIVGVGIVGIVVGVLISLNFEKSSFLSMLIDIRNPRAHKQVKGKDVVENITYPSLQRMVNGKYVFRVHQFAARGSRGFKAEIEFGGETFVYSYDKPIENKKFVDVAIFTFKDFITK